MPLEGDDFVFRKVNWPLPLRRGWWEGFRLTIKLPLSEIKPNCWSSLMTCVSNDSECSIALRHPMRSILEHKEELNYFDIFIPFLTQNKIFEITSCHKYLIVLWYQLRWTSRHRPIKFNTFQGYSHMDHCIGCHTSAFTVAYTVLWLEVLLYYSTVKVFHIRRAF